MHFNIKHICVIFLLVFEQETGGRDPVEMVIGHWCFLGIDLGDEIM